MTVRTIAAMLLGVAALAGCGGGEPEQHVGGPDLGVPIRIADCSDWRDAAVGERLGTVRELRTFAGGPTGSPAGHGQTIDDERAYDLLDRQCGQGYASGFKLYKLYTRAAAFSGVEGQ